MSEYYDDEQGPQDGDYMLSPTGPLGGQTLVAQYGKALRVFAEDDDARKFIRARMDREQFWPNVWVISDHGNETLITV